MITAPFNFVPLNQKIYYPNWEASHDIPLQDTQSGMIEIELSTYSPIFIKNSTDNEFCNYNGEYYIPATSIKGMLRNVLEIMSFGEMQIYDNDRYAMRDLKNENNNKPLNKDNRQKKAQDKKIALEKQIKALINRQSKIDKPDLASLIFGYTSKEKSLKGRVFISHAKCTTQNPSKDKPATLVLSSPKASYYPIYIKQNEKLQKYKTYDDLDATISGYKRYPVHEKISTSQTGNNNEDIKTTLIPLKAGAKFRFKIAVHNLNPIELGALFSAITFHNTPECFHSIGMAKPFGYGKIKLEIKSLNGFEKSPQEYMSDFETALNAALFSTQAKKWHESEQIANLFSMSVPQNDENLKYMELKNFATAKRDKDYLRPYIKLQGVNPLTPKSLTSDEKLQTRIQKAKQAELKEQTKGMSELDAKLFELKASKKYSGDETIILYNAIFNEEFQSNKKEALLYLKEKLQKEGAWDKPKNKKGKDRVENIKKN
ncbi:MAG: TIGR03986 family CRISPR-associated RAMP protein [Campylobacter sp.]|nr:TIGR03986 family CRISPR-associated RAMP protein [Campylobacter sp.]